MKLPQSKQSPNKRKFANLVAQFLSLGPKAWSSLIWSQCEIHDWYDELILTTTYCLSQKIPNYVDLWRPISTENIFLLLSRISDSDFFSSEP
jgi:hypothetical protein